MCKLECRIQCGFVDYSAMRLNQSVFALIVRLATIQLNIKSTCVFKAYYLKSTAFTLNKLLWSTNQVAISSEGCDKLRLHLFTICPAFRRVEPLNYLECFTWLVLHIDSFW